VPPVGVVDCGDAEYGSAHWGTVGPGPHRTAQAVGPPPGMIGPHSLGDHAMDHDANSSHGRVGNDDQDDEYGLAAGLAGLSGLVAGAGTLEQLLTEIATFAVRAVPGANGAGVTMLERGEPDTIVASDAFVRDVDSIQYRIGEGPCISAAATGRTTASAALGEDEAWPSFGPLAAELGIHSALSLPLNLNGETLGALNVYAHKRNAFDGSSQRIGELFAGPAAVAIHNARTLDHALRVAVRLETALTSRSMIDRAVGIVMSRSGLSPEDAFARLRILSQQQHIKLSIVAENLVAEAVRSAQARNAAPTLG
jgi:GAF domain-containing protein